MVDVEKMVARTKGRRAFELVKKKSAACVGTVPNLYKKCCDGVATLEELKARGIPEPPDGPHMYGSLAGQLAAKLVAEASVDSVLTVLIEQRRDGGWDWVLVTENGLIIGSREAAREECENAALIWLSLLGREMEPAPNYEPVEDPENWTQIRIYQDWYLIPVIPRELMNEALDLAVEVEKCSFEVFQARMANLVLNDGGIDVHYTAALILANLGWSQLTQRILENFCAMHGIDMEDDLHTTQEDLALAAKAARYQLLKERGLLKTLH